MKHRIFLGIVFSEILVLILLYTFSIFTLERRAKEITFKKSLVRELMITDLSVWTEARYTRHPSQADLFTPFQDFPLSIEHFPAGSVIAPPYYGENR